MCKKFNILYVNISYNVYCIFSVSNITFCIYNCLSEDEPTRFETCRRQQKFNIDFKNCEFHLFMLYNCITIHGEKKHKKRKYNVKCNNGHKRFKVIIIISNLSNDRSKASSKTIPPHSAIYSFLLQLTVSSPVLKVIQ